MDLVRRLPLVILRADDRIERKDVSLAVRLKEPHAIDPRKLPSGRWKGRVQYWDPDTGIRKETTQTFATEREAKKWSRDEERRLQENPRQHVIATQTVGAVITQWLATVESQVDPNTYRSYRQMARHSIREWEHLPIQKLTTLEIQQFYTRLGQTRSSRTVNYVHTVLQMALEAAVDWEIIPKNPAAKAKAPRGTRSPLRIPSPDEMEQLLRATQESRWFTLWAWCIVTGTRMGETLGLTWDAIDWARQAAVIRQAVSGAGTQARIKVPKTERGIRTIALGARLMGLLQAQRAMQAEWKALAGTEWVETGAVFTTYRGTRLSSRNVDRAFKQALDQAGLPADIRIHDLRHGMATQWLAAGIAVNVVSERLGHTSIAFTPQTYGHVLPHQQAGAATTMEDQVLGTVLEVRDGKGPADEKRAAFGPHELSKTP